MECGNCTLCCKLLPIKELNKETNVVCKHVCNNGCSIYGKHPTECSIFNCAYSQMEGVNINFRPDRCKVIFEKINDKLFFGTQDPEYTISQFTKDQIHAFNTQGFSVLISTNGNRKLFLTKDYNYNQLNKDMKQYLENRK